MLKRAAIGALIASPLILTGALSALAAINSISPTPITQSQVFNAPLSGGDGGCLNDVKITTDMLGSHESVSIFPPSGVNAITACNDTDGTAYFNYAASESPANPADIPVGAYTVITYSNIIAYPLYGIDSCATALEDALSLSDIETLCVASDTAYFNIAAGSFVVTADAAAPAGAVTIPTTLTPALSANVGDQVGDPGTLLIIGIVAGVPLFFYVVKQLIELLPRYRRNKSGDR
jgi:hypothetical protein